MNRLYLFAHQRQAAFLELARAQRESGLAASDGADAGAIADGAPLAVPGNIDLYTFENQKPRRVIAQVQDLISLLWSVQIDAREPPPSVSDEPTGAGAAADEAVAACVRGATVTIAKAEF